MAQSQTLAGFRAVYPLGWVDGVLCIEYLHGTLVKDYDAILRAALNKLNLKKKSKDMILVTTVLPRLDSSKDCL